MPYHHLTRTERKKIEKFSKSGMTIRQIARILERSASTISREMKRNAGVTYKARDADEKYHIRRENSHRSRLYEDEKIREYVTERLLRCWSPEQIAGRLKVEKQGFTLSFSSIYRWLTEGLFPRAIELKPKLRHFRKRKKAKKKASRSDARSIQQRSKSVLRRRRFGDWEVDTISFGCFPNQTYILTAAERRSRYTALVVLKNIKRETVMRAFELIFADTRLPLRTMTSDRGMEFNCHNQFEERFQVPFYYTDAGKPYQKPTIENTNGLLRQYLPRKTKIRELPAQEIPQIMSALNNRPRKCLGFRTPNEVLHFS